MEGKLFMLKPTRLKTIWLWCVVFAVFLLPGSGICADSNGFYTVSGGGTMSCGSFVQARRNRLDYSYDQWIAGYLTAINELTPETNSIQGTKDRDGLML